MSDLRQTAQQALEALEDPWKVGAEGVADAITALRAALRNEFNPDWDQVEALQESLREHMAEIQRLRAALAEPQIEDPAIHFCHRFAILMECMMLSNDSNLDKYWDEAHALLDGYHKAQEWWQHQMGEPYVSGFGKD